MSRWPRVITRVPVTGRKEGRLREEIHHRVWEKQGQRDAGFAGEGGGEGAGAKGCRWLLEAGKSKELPEGKSADNTLTLAQRDPRRLLPPEP